MLLSIQTVAKFSCRVSEIWAFNLQNPERQVQGLQALAEFSPVFCWQLLLAVGVALVFGMIWGGGAFLSALAGMAVVLLPSWWQARVLLRCPRGEKAAWRCWRRSHFGKWLAMSALVAAFVIGGRETLDFPVFFALILISQLAVLPALLTGQAPSGRSG